MKEHEDLLYDQHYYRALYITCRHSCTGLIVGLAGAEVTILAEYIIAFDKRHLKGMFVNSID